MTSSVSLPVFGPVSVEAPEVKSEPGRPVESITLDPRQIVAETDRCYIYSLPARFFDPNNRIPAGDVRGAVLENNQILGPPATAHSVIRKWGQGRYSLWSNPDEGVVRLFFSTSDGSDPRTNGRTYTVMNQPLAFANEWEHRLTRRWLNHSRGQYLLRRGGDKIPPPLFANMGITDICNLKCGICGSQNMMQPVNRRHMDFHIFESVANTLFPLLICVELNSRGEPLLHPRMPEMLEILGDYGIFLRVQTNGTQFVGSRLTNLLKQTGEISISIDATGDVFEYARTNGKWPQVDEGIRNFMRRRDPDRLAAYIYPTLTEATIRDAPNLIRWAMEVGIDRVDFHTYDPIYGGNETIPSAASVDELKRFASKMDSKHPMEIRVCYETVKPGVPPLIPHPVQEKFANIPRRAGIDGSHPDYVCMAPHQLVDLDLDGGVCVCCMLQERKLGNALTVEAFADCWFGGEYQALRNSMCRGPDQNALYETCRGCIKSYAQ